MSDKICFSSVKDPNKWEGFHKVFECKNSEEAMKAEKFFNEQQQIISILKECVDKYAKKERDDIERTKKFCKKSKTGTSLLELNKLPCWANEALAKVKEMGD